MIELKNESNKPRCKVHKKMNYLNPSNSLFRIEIPYSCHL